MYLIQIFRASPLMGLALCICLTTILWCFLMAKRQRNGLDKILTGVLGLIAVYEAVRVLKDAGVILFPGIQRLDGWVDFLIASMYLIAALILKVSSSERHTTDMKLRLVEANEKTVEFGKGIPVPTIESVNLLDASPLAIFAVDVNGAVTYWNPASEKVLGWTRDEMIGQQLPAQGKGPLRNKQGHEISAAIWTAPIRASNGVPRGILTIAAEETAYRDALATSTELAFRH